MSDITDTGITIRPHKTANTTDVVRTFEWTPALRAAVDLALAARPIDLAPWLFCTKHGEGYFNEHTGQATGWDSMWQRFMTRLLTETKITHRFTEHDLRAKCASDAESWSERGNYSATPTRKSQNASIAENRRSSGRCVDATSNERLISTNAI